MTRKRVLVVDDSALMREVLGKILRSAPDLEVVGSAADPVRAQQMIVSLKPDVLTLDVEMPQMDGITFLEQLMRRTPMPVVMVSSLTEKGSQLALRALELGAFDVVEKPKLDIQAGTMSMAQALIDKVRAAAMSRPRAVTGTIERPRNSQPLTGYRTTTRLVAIGASTGGTEALAEVLSALPAESPAVLIVQHMPPRFTKAFAARLDRMSRIEVREARDGDAVRPGLALLAPGDQHMRLVRSGAAYSVRLSHDPPINGHRPAVDALFESCAALSGSSAVGVILTGMGADGANGLVAMRAAGARTIAQDEHSCVVFGMPKEAIARGGADQVLGLPNIASAILKAAA